MNQKQFSILVVLVLVLGGAGLCYYQKSNSSWSSGGQTSGQKLLGEFQVNDVAQLLIIHGTNELLLARKDDLWRVRERGDYPANFADISRLLIKLRDLKVVQAEQIGPSQLPRLELAAPGPGSNTATLVELRDSSGKVIKSLLLGKKHMQKPGGASPLGDMDNEGYPDGRYVMTDGSSGSVILIGDALTEFEPKSEQWLNKDFFKVEKARSIVVTFPEATNSWQITRETEAGEWKLTDAKPGEELDSSKVSGVSNPFSSPTINDVALGLSPEQSGLSKATIIKVGTFDGFNYTVSVGSKTNDSFPVNVAVVADLPKERVPGKDEKPEDKTKLDKEFADAQKKLAEKLAAEQAFAKWTYLVSSWTVDPLLKERSQLLTEKKEEPKPGESKPEAATPEPKPPGY
jgi:hypothetical protein